MAYKLEFSDQALSKLEDLGRSDAKRLWQVFLKVLSLRREPRPQDTKELKNFQYKNMTGLRVDQGEYRIVYTVDESKRTVFIGLILSRKEDYRELERS